MKKQLLLLALFLGFAVNNSYARGLRDWFEYTFQEPPATVICYNTFYAFLISARVDPNNAVKILNIFFIPSDAARDFLEATNGEGARLCFYAWDTPNQIAQIIVDVLNVGIPIGVPSYLLVKLGQKIYRKLHSLRKDDEPTEQATLVEEP